MPTSYAGSDSGAGRLLRDTFSMWTEQDSSAQVFQTSNFSAISKAPSSSTPGYRTALSIA